MTAASELIHQFRVEVDDALVPGEGSKPDEDSLWKTDEILGYLNEAQTELAVRTKFVLRNKTVSFQAGDEILPHPEGYLEFRHARLTGSRNHLPLRNVNEMQGFPTDDYGNTVSSDWLVAEGPPKILVGDYDPTGFRMVPKPTEAGSIEINYYGVPDKIRHSLSKLVFPDDTRYDRLLLSWMKKLAYEKQDADTVDPQRAATFEAIFERELARLEPSLERSRRRPGTTRYGGL